MSGAYRKSNCVEEGENELHQLARSKLPSPYEKLGQKAEVIMTTNVGKPKFFPYRWEDNQIKITITFTSIRVHLSKRFQFAAWMCDEDGCIYY